MIISPNFVDHWRTRLVAELLGDSHAPIYIMRLWSHCSNSRSTTMMMPPSGLKAQCQWPGHAAHFESALIEAGLIVRDAEFLEVQLVDYLISFSDEHDGR